MKIRLFTRYFNGGLSTGSLYHFFKNKEEILVYALKMLSLNQQSHRWYGSMMQ